MKRKIPADLPERPLSDVPAGRLEAYAVLISDDYRTNRDDQLASRISAIYRLHAYGEWPPLGGITAVLAELGHRRSGQDQPGPAPARGTGRWPVRHWRVFGASREPQDLSSQAAMEEAYTALCSDGSPVTVYRWRNETWQMYSHTEPSASPPALSADSRRPNHGYG
jgi:hypothetical protein